MKALAKTEAQPAQIQAWTHEQRDLIRRTCAPGATDDELAMYLHVAKTSGLDPLRRQLHFVKVQGRVHFIADVNGLQARAASEPDFEGILHAAVYEKDAFEVDQTKGEVTKHVHNPFGNNGKLVGAWAVVRRRGMAPFLSIVRFSEYENGNNPLWKTKPAVMIDKVAKSTALRLAYPTQLGGIYDRAEMDKAIPPGADQDHAPAEDYSPSPSMGEEPPPDLEEARRQAEADVARERVARTVGLEEPTITHGRSTGKRVRDLPDAELLSNFRFFYARLKKGGLSVEGEAEFRRNLDACRAEETRRKAQQSEPGSQG